MVKFCLTLTLSSSFPKLELYVQILLNWSFPVCSLFILGDAELFVQVSILGENELYVQVFLSLNFMLKFC